MPEYPIFLFVRSFTSFIFSCARRETGAILTLLPAYPYTSEQLLNQVRRGLAVRDFTTAVLEQIAAHDPKAKGANPKSFMDLRFIKQLEESGFIKGLYPKG